jgi:hypothetical protein
VIVGVVSRIARRRAEEEGGDTLFVPDDEVGGHRARSAASGASNQTLNMLWQVTKVSAQSFSQAAT